MFNQSVDNKVFSTLLPRLLELLGDLTSQLVKISITMWRLLVL